MFSCERKIQYYDTFYRNIVVFKTDKAVTAVREL